MGRILTGFLAAMIAVLAFHQPMIWLLSNFGMMPPNVRPYNMGALATALPPVAAFFKGLGFAGWPTLFNGMFWGGVWGIVFALIHPRLPGGAMVIKGLIFGMLILVLSNWIVLPLIRSQPLFAGLVPPRMLAGALIQAAFGIGTALLYSMMRRDA